MVCLLKTSRQAIKVYPRFFLCYIMHVRGVWIASSCNVKFLVVYEGGGRANSSGPPAEYAYLSTWTYHALGCFSMRHCFCPMLHQIIGIIFPIRISWPNLRTLSNTNLSTNALPFFSSNSWSIIIAEILPIKGMNVPRLVAVICILFV